MPRDRSAPPAEETIGETWAVTSLPSHILKNPNPNDGIKQLGWFGISPSQDIYYYLTIPSSGSYSISGVYVLDAGSQMNTGTRDFVVHTNTCQAGTDEDKDGDNYGKGCACAGRDCCDSGNEPSLGCSVTNAPNMNPGKLEGNNAGENDQIDQNCDGCDFKDTDNDGYTDKNYLGINGKVCGNDCNDNDININPGKTEINCNGKNDNCFAEACPYSGANGDCCPPSDSNDYRYYDTNCDCRIDICNNFIAKYLAGEIDPPLQMVIDAIPLCGYSNP